MVKLSIFVQGDTKQGDEEEEEEEESKESKAMI